MISIIAPEVIRSFLETEAQNPDARTTLRHDELEASHHLKVITAQDRAQDW
jgi:hypothetical protein